jgi:hypothetical protein
MLHQTLFSPLAGRSSRLSVSRVSGEWKRQCNLYLVVCPMSYAGFMWWDCFAHGSTILAGIAPSGLTATTTSVDLPR